MRAKTTTRVASELPEPSRTDRVTGRNSNSKMRLAWRQSTATGLPSYGIR